MAPQAGLDLPTAARHRADGGRPHLHTPAVQQPRFLFSV